MADYAGFITVDSACILNGLNIDFDLPEGGIVGFPDIYPMTFYNISDGSLAATPSQLAADFSGSPMVGYMLNEIPLAALSAYVIAVCNKLADMITLEGRIGTVTINPAAEYGPGEIQYFALAGSRSSSNWHIPATLSTGPAPLTRTTKLQFSSCQNLTSISNFGSLFKYIHWE